MSRQESCFARFNFYKLRKGLIMAHEIDGNNAFFVSTPAWHSIGHVLNDAPTFEEAIRLATNNHSYIEIPLKAVLEDTAFDIQNSKAIFRDDGREIGVVGKDFELLQPHEAFKPLETLVNSGLVTLEAGGLLREGRQAWLLGKLKGSQDARIIGEDYVKQHILIYVGFDGSLSFGMQDSVTRVVCANTLAIARSEEKNINFRFKHTKNVRTKIDNAETVISEKIARFLKTVEAYQYLASKKVTEDQQRDYIGKVICTDAELSGDSELSTRKQNIVMKLWDKLDNQRGLELVPAIRGTAWQAYNAVSEYVTHDYGRNDDTRLQSQWFGESAKMNNKALELALAM